MAIEFGHREGDLIAFKVDHGKANLTSLIARKSRFTVLTPNNSRHSAGMMGGIERRLGALPPSLRRTITFDRGTEFAGYRRLRESLGMTAYFCQPSSPWQKGSVEDSNGRVRRFSCRPTQTSRVHRQTSLSGWSTGSTVRRESASPTEHREKPPPRTGFPRLRGRSLTLPWEKG